LVNLFDCIEEEFQFILLSIIFATSLIVLFIGMYQRLRYL
jgi:hypothetical protein